MYYAVHCANIKKGNTKEIKEIITYQVNDPKLHASVFIPFVNKVWPGDYDIDKTQTALLKTLNITAYDGNILVGCLMILSDGYYFGTITELLILPTYQNLGIGSRWLQLTKDPNDAVF